ncbi:MAG: HDOD domain-containing protein [Burkholderiaceae bacterium]|nr:HDOD domain-containing protein [Burkholderiaceae bacterium]
MFELPPQRRDNNGEPMHLDAVTPAWSAIVARDARPIGFRLALRRAEGAGSPPLAALLDRVLAGFVAEGSTSFPHGLVLLAPLDFGVDASLASFRPPRNVLLEVAQADLDDAERMRLLFDVQRHGVRLALRVEDRTAVSRDKLPLFQYVVADAATHGPPPKDAALLALAVATRAQAEATLKAGAHAIVGWPLTDAPPRTGSGTLQPTHRAVLELIRLVQGDADIAELERAFRAEPVLAYLLLTLANSPAFIRATPVASLGQAIGLLGYKRLVKWLVLLMVIASKESKALPQIYTAVARGFCMENLAAATGAKPAARDDCFVVGAFSLLDKITGQSMAQLFDELPLPPAVRDAVRERSGPYAAYLELALALEDGGAVREHAAALDVSLAQVNAALLQALAAADALQSVV